MHRQVGDLKIDSRGIAERGLLIRHLVMPSGVASSESVLKFIAEEISVDSYVNIMQQYRPEYEADQHRRSTDGSPTRSMWKPSSWPNGSIFTAASNLDRVVQETRDPVGTRSTQSIKLHKLLLEIESLKRQLRCLSREIESIKAVLFEDPSPVEKVLKMRGMEVFQKNPTDQLFFPFDIPAVYRTKFYEMLKKYSFRLVLRDMIKRQDRFHVQDLTHYCTPKVARKYCELLSDMGIIVRNGRESFRTAISPLYSFGPTLEWFVAEMFKRAFASPALYCVTVKGTPSGGDYDVIASWNRRLVYVEVKSSPPKGVEQSEVTTFFSRIEELQPDVAILFEDTQLRMKDKLVVLFEEELKKRSDEESAPLYAVERLVMKSSISGIASFS